MTGSRVRTCVATPILDTLHISVNSPSRHAVDCAESPVNDLGRRAASEARLRRFAADASHELRTPLSAIRGYAELALRHPGPVPEDVTHALRRVESESARMSVLVDDLLLLARLDAGRPLEREPVDLSRLAIDTTSDARV